VIAWSVHALTASGAVWAFLSILAVLDGELRLAFLWMMVAMLTDSVDGTLARWADVQAHAGRVDGALLDNIIDYLNYVVVPAFILVKGPPFLPPGFATGAAIAILLSSAYQFTQREAKTADNYFKGFPSYWNVAVVYLLVAGFDASINLAILAALNVLIFVPLKYVYPSRTTHLRRLTILLTVGFAATAAWGLAHYPVVPRWTLWVAALFFLYYVGVSIWLRRFITNDR
jgi:phosphatidylcholine synthase